MASANGCTGDVRNNLAKLLREIQRMKLTVEPNIHGLSLGIPSAFLPIIHCALMQYSVPLANWLASRDYELYAKNDFRFVEGVYKVMRDVFYYHPRLSMSQFLDVGFAERKIIMTTDILRYCQAKHRELMGKPPQSRTRRKLYPAVTSGSIAGVGIHPMPKAYIEDCRTTSACSERQPAMVDYRTTFHSASSSPDPAPRSLSVSPIEGLGSSAHSSPCKDSAPHIIHPSLNPPLFSSRLADTVPVSHLPKNDHSLPPKADHSLPPKADHSHPPKVDHLPPKADHSHPPKVDHSHQTHEPSKMERLVIRHRDDGKVAKETGLPVHRQEEVAQGDVMASLAFLPKGLDKEAREKHGDDVESVASWQSLPLHEEQGGNGRQDDVNQRPSSSCQTDDGTEVCSKIDLLTQMIEKLSARFVIFETQMKLMESQRGGGKALSGQQHAEAPNHPEDKDRNKQPPSTPSSLPPPPSRGGPTPAGGTLGTSGPSALPPVHSFHISQRTKSTLPLKPAEAVPPTDVPAQGKEAEGTSVRERWRQMVLAEQGSPGWTPVARPCWSSVGKSTPGVTPPAVQSPSTPEDTRRLIEGLRQRAKKTKEFLDKATL